METAHFNMVEQQLRTWGILNHRALTILSKIDRRMFVPENFLNLAFADVPIIIGDESRGEVMLAPKIIGRILQALLELPAFANDLTASKILLVGSGTGYSTAIFAHLAEQITSIEISKKLAQTATKNLAAANITNCQLIQGNGLKLGEEKFNYIILTGATPSVPRVFADMLIEGGSIFAFTGNAPAMQAQLITKLENDAWHTTNYFETLVPVLHGLPKVNEFKF
jgi:protein-L-isoaspartate(D-aspartate) O-methyltransferase